MLGTDSGRRIPPVIRAPEIARPGLIWFNTPKPLSLAQDLRGRLVILDFWTFCCVNCLEILPTLRRVEDAFPDTVAVIGVHSPKFPAERDPAAVAAAIRRAGIRHPVVHDRNLDLWGHYAVRAWPTLVFITPDGRVAGRNAGAPDPDLLLEAVGNALAEYRAEGRLAPRALELTPEDPPAGLLGFPGKLKRLPESGVKPLPESGVKGSGNRQWAVADAGHHRIVLLDDDGGPTAIVGSGTPGFADGPGPQARFTGPQGLAADAAAIYVADTGNHALRRIDRATGMVTTLAGTGARGAILGAPAPGRQTALASPWDCVVRERAEGAGDVIFANAGTHQIGRLDLADGSVARLAGGGPEGLRDGHADEAHLAQPSGLALDAEAGVLLIADAETSAVRALDLDLGRIRTLVGAGLFEFGHENGLFETARLQHCLGLALAPDGRILVADSYNGAVRVLDPARRRVADFDDGRFLCTDPVCLPLAEPAGIVADGPDRVLVVDTNNHRIVEYRTDPQTGAGTCRTWCA